MAQASPAPPAGFSLAGSARRRRREAVVRAVFLGSALATVVISVFIVWTVLSQAIVFLGQIDLDQLVGIGWFPRRGIFDIATLLIGTLIVTVIAMAIATPVGPRLGDLPRRSTRAPRSAGPSSPILEVLAGIPSVVLGFFALTVITPDLLKPLFERRQRVQPRRRGRSASGSCPCRSSPRSPRTRCGPCPRNLREASYGLGARKLTTSIRVVFPAAISGHRRRADPRDQPRDRRDDGRRRRRRRAPGADLGPARARRRR